MAVRHRRLVIALLFALGVLRVEMRPFAQGEPSSSNERHEGSRRPDGEEPGDDRRMSGMGHVARLAATGRLRNAIDRARAARLAALAFDEDDGAGFAGGQAETSIAVDSTGQHIVVGINDTRGFSSNPVSVSGFTYSDDGGATFVDGGQLPITTGTSSIGSTTYPQVYGDPEVKYLGGSTFLYFSIMVKKFSSTGTAQTMGVHRSTDYGHTWQGPYEIGPATNPNGLTSGGNGFDAADKEFADVDPDTGRVMMTWSNFTSTLIAPGGVEISSTYSDNVATATPPTWSTRVKIANSSVDGQASIPRFAGHGSANVYVAWRQFPGGLSQNVGFARSTNNGATFSTPVSLSPTNFMTMDYVLGNDRSNTSPSLAVDNSSSPDGGDIYVVYSNNDNNDGADIVFQKSLDQGLTFSAPMKINSRPGTDRAQWFPWVTVDSSSGRIYVFYYDQGITTDGDLTETTYQHSDDGGTTWSKPMPLTDRPFHAGYGNDTGQPNIGDYNQAIAQGGDLLAVWAGTPPLVGFSDGEPASASMTEPFMFFKRVHAAGGDRLPVSLGAISLTDSGPTVLGGNGFIDAGEQIAFTIPLTNYVTNGLNAGTVSGISATLSTTTPGVTVLQGGSTYPNLAAGVTAANNVSYAIAVSGAFQTSTHIDLSLAVTSAQGSTTLLFSEPTGTPAGAPLTSTLVSENFDEVAAGSLPAGWTTSHGGGGNIVPWTTSNQSLGASPTAISNAAFHANANDGLGGNNTRWERLFSPSFVVPVASEYVTVDFDIAYDTEDEPALKIQAYDGALLRVFDQSVPTAVQRSVAVEAFAEQFTTGAANFYPKHIVNSSLAGYFPDLSAWAGDSSGYKHVHLKLPGMAGSTAQLRFEFTQDNIFTCANVRPGHRCGVLIDNVVVKSVQSVTPTQLTLATSANPATVGQLVTFTATVTTAAGNFPTDGAVTFTEGSSALAGPVTLVSGHASFTTSRLAAGPHTITAGYSSTSGMFSSATASVSEVLGSATTASISSNDLTFDKQLVATVSAASQVVHLTNTGANPLFFASFNGAPPSTSFSVGSGDFQGQTNCPLTLPGLSPGSTCDFAFSFSPTAVGLRSANLLISDTATNGPQNIAMSGTGFVVDAPTVLQALTTGGSRLLSLQNPDGGWFFEAGLTSCVTGAAPNVSCLNITGVTALGMLGAYAETKDPSVLAGLKAAGNAIVKRYNSSLPSPPIPYDQDIEFLAWLSQLTGTTSYLTTAQAWFQVVTTQFPIAEDRITAIITARNNQGLRSLVAWDAASLIRAAKAAGNTTYASAVATSVLNHETDWKDENPANPLPNNPFSYYLTILGEGSILWAEHDLPGFSTAITEYTNFLLGNQDAAGSWDGDMQVSAYVTVGLAAVGGTNTNSALQSAAAFYIENQLSGGGWVGYADGSGNPVENVEIDGEVARAMAAFFNTTAGSSISVAPAQLSRITFNSVTIPGRTRVVAGQLPTVTRVPGGYTILDNLTYEVATSASFSGSTTVCFSVPWVSDPVQFSRVRILHDEGGVLVDRTILEGPLAPNFASRSVCAAVSSLDAFAIAIKTIDSDDHPGEDRDGPGEDRDGRDKNDKKERKENKDDKKDRKPADR